MSNQAKGGDEDEELSNLLDCALQDFDHPIELKPKVENAEKNEEAKNQDQSTDASLDPVLNFKKFEEAMCSLLSDDSLKENLNNLNAATEQEELSTTSDEEIAISLAKTLKGLTDNVENIFASSNDDFSQILNNLATNTQDESGDAIPNILPLMQDVMQKLLSKELLYPALKDIVLKYPKWLEEQQGVLEQQQYDRYCQQYELMKQVCDEFEKEVSSEDEKERFEKIMALMQKMHDCGHPPKELVGEMTPEIEFDEQGNPKIPGLQGDQCCIM